MLMKKVLKVTLYSFFILAGLLISLLVFLNIYYNVMEKKQNAEENAIIEKSKGILLSSISYPKSFETKALNLIPVPQKVKFNGGTFRFPVNLVYSVTDSLQKPVEGYLSSITGLNASFSRTGGILFFRYNRALPEQGYTIDISQRNIIVEYSSQQGLYYATITLKVLKQNYSGSIPCVFIEDFPDLKVRGLMLDISRDKVPTLETLKGLVQLLGDLKYNHFELYVEGFSFAYPSFKSLWEGKETPITGDEIKELDAFCKSKFIDLVPNQNLFGHMTSWLATDQFRDLAECPKGYKMFGLVSMKGTVDPGDSRSLELVKKMTDDLLPNFSSDYYNVNLDEPFELGKGKSKELVEKKGEGQVYLDFALKIHDIAKSKNKKMLMWGDIVLKHPYLIPQIPKDITLLDWGYESSYPFERHCKSLQAANLKYMVCPGTSSWSSGTGRTENMIANIESATTSGVKYGADGMLLTDWGDLGHWQYLPVSYAGYTVGGGLSWNSKSLKELPLITFLNSYVFRDKNSVMGNLVLDLGNYYRLEPFSNVSMTSTMLSFQFGLRDKIMLNAIFNTMISGMGDMLNDIAPEMISVIQNSYDSRHPFDFQGLDKLLDSGEALLAGVKIQGQDSVLITDEYFNSIRIVRLGGALQSYIQNRSNLSLEEEKEQLTKMKELGNQYLSENKRLWGARNKPGGYDRSSASLNSLLSQINNRLILLDKSSFARGINRFFEKAVTAGAVMYIKSAN